MAFRNVPFDSPAGVVRYRGPLDRDPGELRVGQPSLADALIDTIQNNTLAVARIERGR
jgi:hypothetical protein